MNQFGKLAQQFVRLRVRERVLATIATMGVFYFFFDIALIRPQQREARMLRQQIEQQNAELAALTQAQQTLMAKSRADPLAKQRAELQQARATYAQAESVVQYASSNLRAGELIRSMMAARPGLSVVSVKTLPAEVLFKQASTSPGVAASAPAGPAVAAIYKHGVEIVVQGTYPALVQYLQSMEQGAKGVFWGDIKLDVVAYPNAVLKLKVYTLSSKSESPLG